MKSFAIYIHVPWCRRRCPYCDFYFVVGRPKRGFVDCLIEEWHFRSRDFKARWAHSLYFGGGTPSLLAPWKIGNLISYFKGNNILKPDAEVTIEANPEDLSENSIRELRSAGVNRISLGIQSFDDDVLHFLGRMHSAKEAKSSIASVKKAGFLNISVDLIIGVNRSERSGLLSSLEYLFEQEIPHISCYLLTIEEKTNFKKRIAAGKMCPPNEDYQAEIYKIVQSKLLELGYVQYDVSSYGKKEFFSQHNQTYWGGGEYLGLGPGAHSMRILSDGSIERVANEKNILGYLNDPQNDQNRIFERLEAKKSLLESLAFGLRNMLKGIDPSELARTHNERVPASFYSIVEKYNKVGWLERQEKNICLNKDGALFADAIMREILCCE